MSSSKMDALNSPGFDASKLSGERLARMKACAEKARGAFPPRLEPVPFEGPVATPEGDRCLARGRWAHARRRPAPRDSGSTGRFGPGWPTAAEIDAELGGADGFFTLCGLHYCNLFANPRMAVLFDTRRPDSAASAMDHGATRAPTARARREGATRARRARTEA